MVGIGKRGADGRYQKARYRWPGSQSAVQMVMVEPDGAKLDGAKLDGAKLGDAKLDGA